MSDEEVNEQEEEKPQCIFIKKDGRQCRNIATRGEYCWMHEGGVVNPEMARMAKKNKPRGIFSHGLHSNKLQLMCSPRCFMYDECEVRTDTEEGIEMFSGICFFEIDASNEEHELLQLSGLKKFMIKHLIKTEQRINRGVRYELSTGGYLSEPEISIMQRNVSSLGFNLLQIMEKEEMGELSEQLDELKELFKKTRAKQ